jgi:phycoerythrin-associated linker protein
MALWIDVNPIELPSHPSEDDLQHVIRAVYRQVLGNAHVMDTQRLTQAESQLRQGDIAVRDFVRAVAQSDLYRTLFFEPSSPYRFIELNFKHLLGRAPQDQIEIADHVQLYTQRGYTAEINSYIDSDEYLANFGTHFVPFARGTYTQQGIKTVGFNRTFSLMRGFATHDTGQSAKLTSDLGINLPTKIVAPAHGSRAREKRFRIAISKVGYGSRVTRSTTTLDVGYNQLAQKIQNIQKTGGKILRITEVS